MTLSRSFAIAAAVALLSACGTNNDSTDAGDVGWTWNGDLDAGTPDALGALTISAMPIFVTDIPTAGEKPVSGSILVQRGNKDVIDAVVKVNGTLIAPSMVNGLYEVGEADVTGIGPGSTVTLEAETSNPPQTASVTFQCPPMLEFSSPAANSLIGDEVETDVIWAPGIPYEGMRMAGGPVIGYFACFTETSGDVVSALGHGSNFLDLTVGQTTQKVTSFSGCARHLLELQYPGEMVMSGDAGARSIGLCSIRHRRWLRGPHP